VRSIFSFVRVPAASYRGPALRTSRRPERETGVRLRSPSGGTRLPSESPHEKKRREAGEVASRRAEANTGNLFATELE
jgi:hypothetical protein